MNFDQGVTAHELHASRIQKNDCVIDNVCPTGLTIMAGRPKQGKSIFATQMAINVAQGESFLGQFNVKKSKVLYLSLEESPELTAERLKRICPSFSSSWNINYTFQWLSPAEGGIEYLDFYLEKYPDIKFVIVDTLSAFINGNQSTGRGYFTEYEDARKIHKVAKDRGVALVLLHHTVKQSSGNLNDLYGSSGYSGTADNILLLNSDKARGIGKLQLTSRYGDAEYALKFNKQQGYWEYLGEFEEVDLSQERQDILEVLLDAHGPVQVKQIAKELGKNIPATSNLLIKLHKQGLVWKPTYRIYELTESGQKAIATQLM